MTLLLDTHAVIWFATESALLGKRSRILCNKALAAEELAICSISFWEIALMVSKGRLEALMATVLDLHPDPADRFIAASAMVQGATLVTADDRLLKWKYPFKRQNARK